MSRLPTIRLPTIRLHWALRTPGAVLWAVLRRLVENDGSVFAGHIAYSLMLALFPFLIFAMALTGFAVGHQVAELALDALFEGVPEHVTLTLKPVLFEVIGQRRGGILTVSGLVAVWAASNGVEAVRFGIDRAYGVPRARHMALSRLIAVAYVLGGFVVFVVLAALIVFAPLAFLLIGKWTAIDIPRQADIVRYAVGLAVLWASLWVMHRVLPSRSMRGLKLWPGVLASVLIWSLAATGLSMYLAYMPGFSVTYGALAGVIITLLFFYLTGLALIFGAEVNAVVNRLGAATRPDAPRGPEG
ncbi:MAG TPA: YihY/virulence factor BrkB family protein [Thermohalobaculum sp.]|nr:YihY/virulence factor BrkB family protein [Thermohalobaculum sp.]